MPARQQEPLDAEPSAWPDEPVVRAPREGLRVGFVTQAFYYLLLVAAPLALFAPTLQFPLLGWDDLLHISSNPQLNELSADSLATFWRRPACDTYMPLTFSFWAGETWLGRQIDPSEKFDPRVFHAGNLLLHVAAVLLLFRVLTLLLRDRRAACLGALLLAVHPLAVESVAWVSETKGLLATVFSLLAIWQYLRATTVLVPLAGTWHYSSIWRPGCYALATLAMLAALLSKPAAVVTPLLVLAIECLWLGRSLRSVLPRLTPWLLPAAALAVAMPLIQPGHELNFPAPLAGRPLVAGDALSFYMLKLVAPLQLCFDHGRTPARVLGQPAVFFTWLVPCGLAAAFVWRRWQAGLLGLVLMTVGLLPVLGFVPFYYQENSTVADRYMYLPLIGPALVFGWLVSRLRGAIGVPAAALVLGALAWLSSQQQLTWESDNALNEHCLAVNPLSATAHANLAATLANAGDYEAALAEFAEAEQIDPHKRGAWVGHAITLLRLGRADDALATCQRALEADARQAEPHYLLGCIFADRQQQRTAANHFSEACLLDPTHVASHLGLGRLQIQLGATASAIEHFQRVLEIDGTNSTARFYLADWSLEQGDLAGAEQQCQQLLQHAPENPTAHRKLAQILEMQGDITAAEQHLDQAAALETVASMSR